MWLSMHFGDVVLKAVNNVSDLGVNADCKLNFCEHFANITRKAHARANLFLRCYISGHRLSTITRLKFTFNLYYSIISYA